MIHRSPFSATNHRGVLLPKDSNIDLSYVKMVLEPVFRELKKGREGDNGENEYTSLPPFMIRDVRVPIPVDSTGRPSLVEQRRIAKKHVSVMKIKEQVEGQLNYLLNVKLILTKKNIQ